MTFIKNILLWIVFIIFSISLLMCVIKGKSEIAVALAGIVASMVIPFGTKNIELEKQKEQFLYEKKYNAYSKYFYLFDEFWKISQKTAVKLRIHNSDTEFTKEEFEERKQDILDWYVKFIEIKDYLSMPGLEILIGVNKQIENKIKEIIKLESNYDSIIGTHKDYKKNKKIIGKYINTLADLSKLLQQDLGIKIKDE